MLCPWSIVLPILPHRLLPHPWSASFMAPSCRWGNGGSPSCSVTISPHLQATSARSVRVAQPCTLTGSVGPIGQASSPCHEFSYPSSVPPFLGQSTVSAGAPPQCGKPCNSGSSSWKNKLLQRNSARGCLLTPNWSNIGENICIWNHHTAPES